MRENILHVMKIKSWLMEELHDKTVEKQNELPLEGDNAEHSLLSDAILTEAGDFCPHWEFG